MTAAGMLLVQMQPPPAIEDEFHDWYDSEHVPEREAVPGFLSAARYVCVDGWPRYMACYDLSGLSVLEEQPYRRIGGENLSPWSKRMLSRAVGLERLEIEQVHPDEDAYAPPQEGMVLIRFGVHDEVSAVRGAVALTLEAPAVRVRVFKNRLPAGQSAMIIEAPALALIPDWSPHELHQAFGSIAGNLIGVWRYRRYRRST